MPPRLKTTLARAFWWRARHDQEIEAEIRFHLSEEARLREDWGEAPRAAQQGARRAFGNTALIKEEVRSTWTSRRADRLTQDLRYTLRTFRKSPALALVITAILGIGIGANTTMFSLIRAVLLTPLSYERPEELVYFGIEDREDGAARRFSWIRFEEMRDAAQSFVKVGAYLAFPEDVTFVGPDSSEALRVARVSANYLEILGVQPLLGRGFLDEEELDGGPFVAMISARMWERDFGSDPSVPGETAIFDGRSYTVVGVLPAGFAFPFPEVDVWTTRPHEPSYLELGPGARVTLLDGFARLKRGVTIEEARAELDVLTEAYREAHPEAGTYGTGPFRAVSLRGRLTGDVGSMLWILFGAVGFVLLIACANAASLLMARTVSRGREFAVRTAVGAGQGRLLRQLLTENLVLACAGGLLGLLLASIAISGIASTSLVDLPKVGRIEMDRLVLTFAVALSLTTGILFGVFPALQTRNADTADFLRLSGLTSASGRRKVHRLERRGLLVVAQVALSVVLLVGAGLLMRSLAELAAVDPGFRPEGLLTVRIPLPTAVYDTPPKRAAFFTRAVGDVRTIPGVESVTLSRSLPTTGNSLNTNMGIPDNPIPSAQLQTVTPGYFDTLGISVVRGRSLDPRDDETDAAPVAVVNESFARMVWPEYPDSRNQPVGFQRLAVPLVFRTSGHLHLEIVGVAADVQEVGLMRDAGPIVYVPQHLLPPQTAYLAVRTSGDPLGVADAVRNAVRAVDGAQPVTDVRTMEDVLGASVERQHLAAWLLGLFASTAFLLSLSGIYGMMAFSVAARRREIGIRRTLGAQSGNIQREVVGGTLALVASGLALGLFGAFALTRLLDGLLFHTSPLEPVVLIGVAALSMAVAAVATAVPAWRATRVDPAETLRLG